MGVNIKYKYNGNKYNGNKYKDKFITKIIKYEA